MSTLESIYTAGLGIARHLLPLLARGDGKLARGIRGREGALHRLAAWGTAERDPDRHLVWFHAPSVGEGLQAASIMKALRKRQPDVQLAYTFFSPSAERLAESIDADVADYLPIDLPREMTGLVEALRPSAVVFSKTEVWPNLTRVAHEAGIPVMLLSATLPPSSSRLRQPARSLLVPAHRRLTRVGAISAEDAQRFTLLGVPTERLAVMGDSRFDQVARRAASVDLEGDLLRPLQAPDRTTIVAGSTWSEDEEPLIEAFASLPNAASRYRLILVPHEPTRSHLQELDRRLAQVGLDHERLSNHLGTGEPAPVLVVDRVGILGDLYALGDVAYVGGGFGSAGLHSVLEPAAFGVPVLFGPRHTNAREAGELIEAGGAFSVADRLDLGRSLARLLTSAEPRHSAGVAAARYVADGIGAAERGADLVVEVM